MNDTHLIMFYICVCVCVPKVYLLLIVTFVKNPLENS